MTRRVEFVGKDIDMSPQGAFYASVARITAMGHGLGMASCHRVEKNSMEANDNMRCIVYRQSFRRDLTAVKSLAARVYSVRE